MKHQISVLDNSQFIKENSGPNTDGWAFESNLEITAKTAKASEILAAVVMEVTGDYHAADEVGENMVVSWGVCHVSDAVLMHEDETAVEIVELMKERLGAPEVCVGGGRIDFLGVVNNVDSEWTIWTEETW